MPSLGIRMRRARRNTGLSQRALAELLGVSHGTVGHWETGRTEPSVRTLIDFSRATSSDLHWLVLGHPNPGRTTARQVSSG